MQMFVNEINFSDNSIHIYREHMKLLTYQLPLDGIFTGSKYYYAQTNLINDGRQHKADLHAERSLSFRFINLLIKNNMEHAGSKLLKRCVFTKNDS